RTSKAFLQAAQYAPHQRAPDRRPHRAHDRFDRGFGDGLPVGWTRRAGASAGSGLPVVVLSVTIVARLAATAEIRQRPTGAAGFRLLIALRGLLFRHLGLGSFLLQDFES